MRDLCLGADLQNLHLGAAAPARCSALCTAARRAAAAAARDTACPTHPLSRGYESYSPRKQHVNATVLPLRRLRHRVLLHGRAALALLILG